MDVTKVITLCVFCTIIRHVAGESACTSKFCKQMETNNTKIMYMSGDLYQDTILNVTTPISNITVKSFNHCFKNCTYEELCHSINYEESTKLCELLKENIYKFVRMVVNATGWKHMSVYNADCKKGVCLNGAICEPFYKNDSYKCICEGRYTGKHCELSKDVTTPDLTNEFTVHQPPGSYYITGIGPSSTTINLRLHPEDYGKLVYTPSRKGKVLKCEKHSGYAQCIKTETTDNDLRKCLNHDSADKCRGYSISIWIQFYTFQVGSPMIVLGADNIIGTNIKLQNNGTNTELIVNVDDRNKLYTYKELYPQTSTWQHFVVTAPKQGPPRVYRDGMKNMGTIVEKASVGSVVGSGSYHVAYDTTYLAETSFFDSFNVWDFEISEDEVQYLYEKEKYGV